MVTDNEFQLFFFFKARLWTNTRMGRSKSIGLTTWMNYFYLWVCRIWRSSTTTTTTPKSLQSCPTLCDPMDCSLPGFSIPGILQARTLEWIVISFSNAWKWKVKVKSFSCVRLLGTPWTAAYQAPPSMGFSRQQYWSGVPLPSPMKKFTILQIK